MDTFERKRSPARTKRIARARSPVYCRGKWRNKYGVISPRRWCIARRCIVSPQTDICPNVLGIRGRRSSNGTAPPNSDSVKGGSTARILKVRACARARAYSASAFAALDSKSSSPKAQRTYLFLTSPSDRPIQFRAFYSCHVTIIVFTVHGKLGRRYVDSRGMDKCGRVRASGNLERCENLRNWRRNRLPAWRAEIFFPAAQ